MKVLRSLVALAVVFAVAACAAAADKAAKKAAKKGVAGVVETVTKDKDNTGTITVKLATKANPDAGTKTIKITADTKFEKVTGTKGNLQTAAAAFSDLQKGARVQVQTKGDTDEAVKVSIRPGKKK